MQLLSTSNPSTSNPKFQSLNLRRFYATIFALCLIFSSFLPVQLKLHNFYLFTYTNYPIDVFDAVYCQITLRKYEEIVKSNNSLCRIFRVLNVTNIVLNSILFFVISIVIDVGLIRFTNHNLKKKETNVL